MYRLALLSFHGCPVARLGEKDTGGMNVYVLQVAREFARRGNKVDVYTRCHDPKDPQIVDIGDGARVIHLKAGPYFEAKAALYQYIPEFLSNLCKFQRAEGVSYDVIHSHYWLSGRIGMALGKKWGVPHVVTFHTLAKTKMRARAGEKEPELRECVEKKVMDSVDAVVVSTEIEKEDLVRLYHKSPHNIHTISAGVDLDLFRPLNKTESKEVLGILENRVILYAGRIEPIKGLDILLRAVSNLEDAADTRLIIVGGKLENDPELERLRKLASELGIQDMTTFVGSVSQRELAKYYNAADVFVLPSYSESFGLVALEAMACGTPVVVSRVGGLKTFVKDGETGYLVPWHCPEPFAQRLDMLLANPALRSAMGRAARAQAEGMGWSGVADRMQQVYSAITSQVWESAAGA